MQHFFRTTACVWVLICLGPALCWAQKKKGPITAYVSPYYSYDDDKDGVPNGRDKCPSTPQGEKVTPFGCPYDTDFDGIYDYEDRCPNEPGPKENAGCPYGDKDNDGVKDNIDKCPETPGPLRLAGCPDTDNDGLADYADACPTVPGLKDNKGCPPAKVDTDGDGVFDGEDLCVTTPGVKSNKGCPEIKEEEKAALRKAFNNLLFETGKDIIKSSSFASLDELAQVLKNNTQAKLHLEGYTDNVGEDDANQTLSENRALAVKKYLVSKGISDLRISTAGYGEDRPVASNDNEKGRALNRRVEMNIKYE